MARHTRFRIKNGLKRTQDMARYTSFRIKNGLKSIQQKRMGLKKGKKTQRCGKIYPL